MTPFHKYDHTDIRPNERIEATWPFMFVADVANENSNLFVLDDEYIDNAWIAEHLRKMGAVTSGVRLEPNALFYAYFVSHTRGSEFLRKLSAWLSQKARLLDKAKSY